MGELPANTFISKTSAQSPCRHPPKAQWARRRQPHNRWSPRPGCWGCDWLRSQVRFAQLQSQQCKEAFHKFSFFCMYSFQKSSNHPAFIGPFLRGNHSLSWCFCRWWVPNTQAFSSQQLHLRSYVAHHDTVGGATGGITVLVLSRLSVYSSWGVKHHDALTSVLGFTTSMTSSSARHRHPEAKASGLKRPSVTKATYLPRPQPTRADPGLSICDEERFFDRPL